MILPSPEAENPAASVIAYLDAVAAGHEPPVTGAAALEAIQLIHRIYDTAAILGAGPGIPET